MAGSVSNEAPAFERFVASLKRPDLFESKGLVAAKWVNAPNNATFPVYEPATGRLLKSCSNFTKAEIVEAIESAYEGFSKYFKTTTAKQRGQLIHQWAKLILANKDDYAEGEILSAVSFVSWFAEEAIRSYGDVIPSSSKDTLVLTLKEPVGVCGIITPWNFPASMIARKIAPAFPAGCAVVIKPPSETPFSALAFAKLALEAGIPADVVHVVPTRDRGAAAELATHPKINKLSFTGSTAVGKYLTGLAAGTIKRVSMELGGNAPFIVFDDADLDAAVEGAMACKFRCFGQTCVCANRIFVHANVIQAFEKKLHAKVEALKLGLGLEQGVTQGPLVNRAAVEKVSQHVQDALNKGGKLLSGGKVPDQLSNGFFYEPTLITGGNKRMLVATDETFGPLAVLFPFRTDEEAVELANGTEFGLAGYFYTKDNSRLLRIAQALQVGMVGANTGIMSAVETPFGGVKESGYGREGSKYGLAE